MNTDGSRNNETKVAAFGGVFRDEHGVCLGDFRGNMGVGSVLRTKLCGTKHGLLQAWNKGYSKVWCEMDSQMVESLINSLSWKMFHACAAILEDIHALKNCDWQVKITYIWREANRCADALARLGSDCQAPWKFWDISPSYVLPMLTNDSIGVIYHRM